MLPYTLDKIIIKHDYLKTFGKLNKIYIFLFRILMPYYDNKSFKKNQMYRVKTFDILHNCALRTGYFTTGSNFFQYSYFKECSLTDCPAVRDFWGHSQV
jgi:hypothetical protein